MPIVKSLPRHTTDFRATIEYIRRGAELADIPLIGSHNFRGTTAEELVQELYQNESLRKYPRKGQIYFYHDIISFNSSENQQYITNDTLQSIIEKYIELRGLDCMYYFGSHTDTNHSHIHCLVAGVKYRTGLAARCSKQELYNLKIQLQNFHIQQFPEIKNSAPEHGKGRMMNLSHNEYQARLRGAISLQKDTIRTKVLSCFSQSKSQEHFLDLLQQNHMHYYSRSGKPVGIITENNKKYRFTRFDLDITVLPHDDRQEQQALAEIQRIRENHSIHNQNLER